MWAAIAAFFTSLPILGNAINKIIGMVTKSPEQQAESVASDTQNDTNTIDKTGRPQ